MLENHNAIFVFPDACWRSDLISSAAFLYFGRDQLVLTMPPSAAVSCLGIEPVEFFQFVKDRNPNWLPGFTSFANLWLTYQTNFRTTFDLLEPLHGTAFNSALFAYPADVKAWKRADELIALSGLNYEQVFELIDPFSAADELARHLFLECYLELYGPQSYPPQDGRPAHVKPDWTALYEYCDERFRTDSLWAMLATAYMFRFPLARHNAKLLLSNPQMISFLAALPVKTLFQRDSDQCERDLDSIAWEFFRQLVSPRLDPVNERSVERIGELIEVHSPEIAVLRRRCLKLAQELSNYNSPEELEKHIARHLRVNVEHEVQAVLSLDRKAVRELLDLVFADEKTWIAIATFVSSLLSGGNAFTAGASIYALSSIGSKAVKVAGEKRESLEASDYALLYRMRQ